MGGALKIINKAKRTEADLRLAYKILYTADKTVTNKIAFEDIEDFNAILDNLQLCSKSRLNGCSYCPFAYKCSYIVKATSYKKPRIMIDGKNLHLINQLFWDEKVNYNFFYDIPYPNQIQGEQFIFKAIYKQYLKLIPETEQTDFIKKMASNFTAFETNRIVGLYNDLGKTKETIQRYVFPVANELPIENYTHNLMGVIDRIDRCSNDVLAMVEYKYGKPKYYNTNQYHKSAINTELGFYALLIQGDDVVIVVDENTTTPFRETLNLDINPLFYYGAMLFFQDIEKTNQLIKINKRLLTATRKKIEYYWWRLDNGIFRPIPRNACTEHCEWYWDLCEFNQEWLDIENSVKTPEELDKIKTEISIKIWEEFDDPEDVAMMIDTLSDGRHGVGY